MSDNKFEDKVLGYLAQLTQEMTGIKQDMTGIKQDVSGINSRLTNLEGTVTKIEVEHGEKLSALFDGYKSNSEQIERIEEALKLDRKENARRFDRLENKVDNLLEIVKGHDESIEVMKRAK
jgi:chromosome segregation ATPase